MSKPETNNYVTKAEACRQLGIHRPTLDKLLARPGAPAPDARKRYDLAALAAFLGAQKDHVGDGLKAVRIEEVRLRCEKLRLELDREKKLTVRRADMDELHGRMAMKLRAFLYSKLENEMPPKMAGLDALAHRIYGRALADEIVGRLGRDVEEWDAA